MHRVIFFILCCITLVSCSLPVARERDQMVISGEKSSSLFNIRVERWATLQFSGLLGLQDRIDGLYYVLLDLTGVKLLEGKISKDEVYEYHPAKGILSESALADFFADSLVRIFFQQPREKPCSWNWLLQFCSEGKTEGSMVKTARIWPFIMWQIDTEEVKEQKKRIIVYSQPWLGVRIFLEEIDHPYGK